MKFALLCNSLLAVPAVQWLLEKQLVSSIGLPAQEHEATVQLTQLAASAGVPVQRFQKPNLAVQLQEWMASYSPHAVLVFTFPWRIPEQVLRLPHIGFLNVHFGLLPQYRGADAIFWSVRNREQEGGITIHQMDARFDTGPVLLRRSVPLLTNDTYGAHFNKLAAAAPALVQQLVAQLRSEKYVLQPQDETKAAYYHKPAIHDLLINWAWPAAQVRALVNACMPWNKGAYTLWRDQPLRIAAATDLDNNLRTFAGPGTVVQSHPEQGVLVQCGDQRLLRLDQVFLNEQFLAGAQLSQLGLRQREKFSTPVPQPEPADV